MFRAGPASQIGFLVFDAKRLRRTVSNEKKYQGECQNSCGSFSHSIFLRIVRERSNEPEVENGNMLKFINSIDESHCTF